MLINISDELKRAKRLDQEERFYREAIAGPTRLGQIAGAFMLAARAGRRRRAGAAFRAIRSGADRSSRSATYNTGTFAFSGPGLAISQGMSVLADRKDYAGVLGLLDYTLAFARQKQEHQSPGAAMRALRARYAALGYTGYVPVAYAIWVGPRYRRRPDPISSNQRIF